MSHGWIAVKCTCVCSYLSIYECVCCLCMRQAREKNRVTKSITLTSQGASLSCYKWLPEWLACQGWEISHAVACKSFGANCHGSPSSIFTSLSGVGDATKSETPLGKGKPAGGQFNDPARFEQDLWRERRRSDSENRTETRRRHTGLTGEY